MASGLLERFKDSVNHLPQVIVSLSIFLFSFFLFLFFCPGKALFGFSEHFKCYNLENSFFFLFLGLAET